MNRPSVASDLGLHRLYISFYERLCSKRDDGGGGVGGGVKGVDSKL